MLPTKTESSDPDRVELGVDITQRMGPESGLGSFGLHAKVSAERNASRVPSPPRAHNYSLYIELRSHPVLFRGSQEWVVDTK